MGVESAWTRKPGGILSSRRTGVSFAAVSGKKILPVLLLLVFAVSRIPGLMPPNFSAAYAFAFCAGVFFPGRLAWWLPLSFMLATDLGLNLYYLSQGYDVFNPQMLRFMLGNYVGYLGLIWLGRRFKSRDSLLSLLGGGLLGALLFYLITNTIAWLFNPFGNPEYVKSFVGWLIALTKGTAGFPSTWEFFRNTLFSGGLFTALFVAVSRLAAAESPADKGEQPEEAQPEPEPEESPA